MNKLKLPQMLTGCLMLLTTVLMFFVIICLCIALTGCTTSARANVPEKDIMIHNEYDAKVIAAYSALLHRIWIDKPSYVEDCLFETDEFLELDEILHNNWEDTFEFWNKQDSIQYHYNWYGGESRCIHEF